MNITILSFLVMFFLTGCAVKSVDNTEEPASEELVEPREPVEPTNSSQGVVPEIPSVIMPKTPEVKMAAIPGIPAIIDSTKENNIFINQVVEASCGQCQFRMTEKSGCDLAVKIDGKSYFVDGTSIHDHGDAHADDGFCEVIRRANVTGKIIDGRFKSESFTLIK